jgi:hypothetical protein
MRTKNASATLLPEEHEALRQLAFKESKSMSSLVRDLLLESPRFKEALSFLPAMESLSSKSEHRNVSGKKARQTRQKAR